MSHARSQGGPLPHETAARTAEMNQAADSGETLGSRTDVPSRGGPQSCRWRYRDGGRHYSLSCFISTGQTVTHFCPLATHVRRRANALITRCVPPGGPTVLACRRVRHAAHRPPVPISGSGPRISSCFILSLKWNTRNRAPTSAGTPTTMVKNSIGSNGTMGYLLLTAFGICGAYRGFRSSMWGGVDRSPFC